MKNLNNLTRRQKEYFSRKKKNWKDWKLKGETKDSYIFINVDTLSEMSVAKSSID